MGQERPDSIKREPGRVIPGNLESEATMTKQETTQEAEIVQEQPTLAVGPHIPQNAEQPRLQTPEQSRVEAVADLVKVAMSKAGTLQLTPEESKALLADFPDSDFQPGASGKEHLIYIEHAALRDRFNSTLGLGQWAIIVRETWNEKFRTEKGKDGIRVYARAMLLVRGCYVAEAVGDMDYFPHNASQNYGDAFEGAKTAAFRRCAKEFGVGLQAWRKGFGDGWKARRLEQMTREKQMHQPVKAEPNGNGNKPLAERLNLLALWLSGQLGVEDSKFVVPYLRSHKSDGTEGAALLPNEDLTALSEGALNRIKADPTGFVNRVKQYAKENDQIPGAEVPPAEMVAEGEIELVTVKEGTTNKKNWKVFTIKLKGDERTFTTFSKTIGEAAKAITGQTIKLAYETNDKGHTALAFTHNGTTIKAGESK